MIHKYNCVFDVWEQVLFKTSGFSIPRSLSPCLFVFGSDQLVLLNGKCEDESAHMNYYLFNIEEDVFFQERSDRKLVVHTEDNQGNRDYSKMKKIYY